MSAGLKLDHHDADVVRWRTALGEVVQRKTDLVYEVFRPFFFDLFHKREEAFLSIHRVFSAPALDDTVGIKNDLIAFPKLRPVNRIARFRDVIIAVKDQGVGIAPQDIEKLFTPFTKTDSKTTHGEKSTGLGFAI